MSHATNPGADIEGERLRLRGGAYRAPRRNPKSQRHRDQLSFCSVVVWCALLQVVSPLGAQEPPSQPSSTTGDLSYLSFNVLVGAATAGIVAKLRGESFSDALVPGAVGGALVYAGKRVSVAEFSGAGLIGRQLAAGGTSIVRNAQEGREPWERLTVPLVIARLHLGIPERRIEGVQVNLAELAALGYAVTSNGLSLDLEESLSSGAPVFLARHRLMQRGGDFVNGLMVEGVILIAGVRNAPLERVLPHERVHVLQHDFASETWTFPVENRLFRHIRIFGLPDEKIRLGIALRALRSGGILLLDSDPLDRAYESEATFLEHR